MVLSKNTMMNINSFSNNGIKINFPADKTTHNFVDFPWNLLKMFFGNFFVLIKLVIFSSKGFNNNNKVINSYQRKIGVKIVVRKKSNAFLSEVFVVKNVTKAKFWEK